MPSSNLNGGIDAVVTTITVASTTAFTASGAIWIAGEYITYSGKTATDFTGCVRGADGTTAAAHSSGVLVSQATQFSGWGEGSTNESSVADLQLRLWSQSNFGEDLLFSPRGGALYLWQPGSGASPAVTTRGVLVSGTDVPSQINEIMVSDTSRIVIAFGCSEYGSYGAGIFDPMLVRWTAQEDYTDWTPAATNQAGSYRLSHGSGS